MRELAPLTQEKAFHRVIGSGATFPFSFSSGGKVKSVAISKGLDKINQSIHNILSTRKGERIMLPEYGCFTGDTLILLPTGLKVPIRELEKPVILLGARDVEASIGPAKKALALTRVRGCKSQGIRAVIHVSFSDGTTIKCTPDHQFLTTKGMVVAEELEGKTVLIVNTQAVDFGRRIQAGKGMRIGSALGDLRATLRVTEVRDFGENAEVFDLVNSDTGNFALGNGVIVSNSNLHKLVFEPNDDLLVSQLRVETEVALSRWEPRISITKVRIVDPNTVDRSYFVQATDEQLSRAREEGWIGIHIEYLVHRINVPNSYVYPFKLHPLPMDQTTLEKKAFRLG